MNKFAMYLSVIVLLCLYIVLPGYGQEPGPAAAHSNIELGGFAGMLLFPDSDLPSFATFGVTGGAYIRSGVEIGLAYSRAGISFFGLELMSINLFDAFVSIDLSPAKRFGVLLRLGGSYLQANALGEGVGGLLLLAGVGFRISPIEMMDLFAQYNARFKYGLISTFEAGIRFRF